MFRRNLNATIMDDNWVRMHVASCVTRHLNSGSGLSELLTVMTVLGSQSVTPETFVSQVGSYILSSNDPSISLARNCVQESIVFCIIENDREEPQVPAFYIALASSAIAKHLLGVYNGL